MDTTKNLFILVAVIGGIMVFSMWKLGAFTPKKAASSTTPAV